MIILIGKLDGQEPTEDFLLINTPLDFPCIPEFSALKRRLNSFVNWPYNKPPPIALAMAGFYYLGYLDEVTCFCCAVDVHNWRRAHDPLERHLANYPNCPYLQDILTRDKMFPRTQFLSPLLEPEGSTENIFSAMDMCRICTFFPVRIVLMPCMHSLVCEHCISLFPGCPSCLAQVKGLASLTEVMKEN